MQCSLQCIKFRELLYLISKLISRFILYIVYWSSIWMDNFLMFSNCGLNLHRFYNSEQGLLWVGALQWRTSMPAYNHSMQRPLRLPFLGPISSHRQVKFSHWELVLLGRVGCSWAHQRWATCKFSPRVIVNDQRMGTSILTELVVKLVFIQLLQSTVTVSMLVVGLSYFTWCRPVDDQVVSIDHVISVIAATMESPKLHFQILFPVGKAVSKEWNKKKISVHCGWNQSFLFSHQFLCSHFLQIWGWAEWP